MTPGVSPSHAVPATAPAHRGIDRLFGMTLLFFWAMQFARGDSTEIIPPDLLYYLLVGPAAAFGAVGLCYVVVTAVRLDKAASWLTVFTILVSLVSIARGDIRSFATLGLFALNTLIIFQVRPQVGISAINVVFAVSILLTTAMFFVGYSIYTFVPGLGNHPDLWWRVSALPSAAEGGLFAMIVFIANLIFRHQRHRIPFLTVSGYMLILNGNRTAIFACLLVGAFTAANRAGWIRTPFARTTFFVSATAVFLLSIYSTEILMALPFADSSLFRTILFREEAIGSFDTGGQVGTAAVRQWIIEQHMGIFREHPFVGIGTFDFRMLTSGYGVLDDATTGSEAFVTALLARIGLISVPLFWVLFLMKVPLDLERADAAICFRMALLVGMVTYGSFVNVYDPVYLILVLGVAGCLLPSSSSSTIGSVPR